MAGETPSEPPPVSVVLYVHNGEPYIDGALRSILGQTHESFELCVVDDGSTDGTSDRLDAVAGTDERVRVLHQPAKGRTRLHETVNAGLAMARHELIAMANADDLWDPRKLEVQVAAFHTNPDLDVCTHDAVFIDAQARVLHGGFRRYDSPWPSAPPRPWQFIAGNPIPNPTTMFRRGILRRIGLQEVGDMHDHQFWFKATVHGCTFLGLPDRLIRYRLHEGSHSTATDRREIIERTRRESAAMMAERYGIDRLVPELAFTPDDRSRAWALSFVASEFWAADAPDVAEQFWLDALRLSDDAAILTGIGMCRHLAGDIAAALDLFGSATAAGGREARVLAASPADIEHVLAPIWSGSEPEIADLIRATDRVGLELGTATRPDPFDHVVVVDAAANAPVDWITDVFTYVGAGDPYARVQVVLDDADDIDRVQVAHACALAECIAVESTSIEVDIVPSGEQGSLIEAHRLDGATVHAPGTAGGVHTGSVAA